MHKKSWLGPDHCLLLPSNDGVAKNLYMSLRMRKPKIANEKTKTQISCAVTAQLISAFVFSSPVRKYRKSYCNHPGVCVGVGVNVSVRVAQMLKFLNKVFISLYLMNMLMDQVDTLHVSKYWLKVLRSTIMTHSG